MKENTYSSGEFASLFNLNKKTLEYYRKIGLFLPHNKDSNGYFRYSHHQIDYLYTILSLKKLNLSLKEIQKYTNNRSPDLLIGLLKEKIIIAEKELYELNKVKNHLQETMCYLEEGSRYSDGLIIQVEAAESLIVAEKEKSARHKQNQVEFKDKMFSPNTSCIGTLISLKDNLYSPRMFMKLYKDKELSNREKKEGLYARKIHKGPHDLIYKSYEVMKKEIKNRGFVLGDWAYEEYLVDYIATDNSEEYVTLIKIEIVKK